MHNCRCEIGMTVTSHTEWINLQGKNKLLNCISCCVPKYLRNQNYLALFWCPVICVFVQCTNCVILSCWHCLMSLISCYSVEWVSTECHRWSWTVCLHLTSFLPSSWCLSKHSDAVVRNVTVVWATKQPFWSYTMAQLCRESWPHHLPCLMDACLSSVVDIQQCLPVVSFYGIFTYCLIS